MKKVFSLILCVLLVCAVCSGCKSAPAENDISPESSSQASLSEDDSPVIKVLVDLFCSRYSQDMTVNTLSNNVPTAINGLMTQLKKNGGPNIEVEYVPGRGTERDNRITSLHTQIMAGKGPDVYLVVCPSPDTVDFLLEAEHPFLFPYVQSSMRQNLFLPLDDYIENAQFMEFDKLTPAVMAAGRTEKGQVVLPMTYEFKTSVFNRADISFYDSLPLTWDEAFASNDPAIWAASSYNNSTFGDALGELADFDTLKLSFSEEDLARVAYQDRFLLDKNIHEGFVGAPPYINCSFSFHNYRFPLSSIEAPSLLAEEAPAMVPLYNIHGGVTANINSFAAIDANTEHPEEAFFVLDLLLSKEAQRDYFFFCLEGTPVHEDLLQATERVSSVRDDPQPISFSDAGYGELCRVRSEINAVKFYSPLDVELSKMHDDIFLEGLSTQEEIAEAAAETYRVLQMMLDES